MGRRVEGGMEVGEEGDYILYIYTYRYTVTTRVTPALRWAVMRAILMFQQEAMDKVTRQCPQTTTFLKRKESRSSIEKRKKKKKVWYNHYQGLCTVPGGSTSRIA